jgi:hypothetical protein
VTWAQQHNGCLIIPEGGNVSVKTAVDYCGFEGVEVSFDREYLRFWVVDVVESDFVGDASDSGLGADPGALVNIEINAVFEARIWATVQSIAFCTFETSPIISSI